MNEALGVMSKWDEEFSIGLLQVVKQKYRGDNFFKGKNRFTSSDGIDIKSLDFPSFQYNVLYVRGSSSILDNEVVIIKDYVNYNKVLEAVFQYNEAMAESIDYLDLHYKLWMKLAEKGDTCKVAFATEIAHEAGLPHPPRRGCFLCEEAATDPISTNCRNCKGYWGPFAEKCIDERSYYTMWESEENTEIRKALAKIIATGIKDKYITKT